MHLPSFLKRWPWPLLQLAPPWAWLGSPSGILLGFGPSLRRGEARALGRGSPCVELVAVPPGRGDREALRPLGPRSWDTEAEGARPIGSVATVPTSPAVATVSVATVSSLTSTSASLPASRVASSSGLVSTFGVVRLPDPVTSAAMFWSWRQPCGNQQLAQLTGVPGEERERRMSIPGWVHALHHLPDLLAPASLSVGGPPRRLLLLLHGTRQKENK